jgi:hypothetical protein
MSRTPDAMPKGVQRDFRQFMVFSIALRRKLLAAFTSRFRL